MKELSTQEIGRIVEQLKNQVVSEDKVEQVTNIAALSVTYLRKYNSFISSCVVFSYPDLNVIEEKTYIEKAENNIYYPPLQSYHDSQAAAKLLKKIKTNYDILLVDGQGCWHPRGVGLASQVGIATSKPTIGCSAVNLFGKFKLPANTIGATEPIIYDGKTIGMAIRTRKNRKPIFVSVGNMISLDKATKYVSQLSNGFRIPEPIRITQMLANKKRIECSLNETE
jgi:deoxyribonuclease V